MNLEMLVADDDPVSRSVLTSLLAEWGYPVIMCQDGTQAWEALQGSEALSLAILDWQMPGLTGPEVCHLVREKLPSRPIHLIILTHTCLGIDALVQACEAGADDYLNKPFEPRELLARLRVGQRMVLLQRELSARVRQLEATLANVKQLQGLLPICGICRRVRDDSNYWKEVDAYLVDHSDIVFSHGLCPDCVRKHFAEFADKILSEAAAQEGKGEMATGELGSVKN